MFVAFEDTTIQMEYVTFFQLRGRDLEFRLAAGGGTSTAVVRLGDDAVAGTAYGMIVKALGRARKEGAVLDLRGLAVKAPAAPAKEPEAAAPES